MGFEIPTGGKVSNVVIKPIWETQMKIEVKYGRKLL
jgi:hypothetical protein